MEPARGGRVVQHAGIDPSSAGTKRSHVRYFRGFSSYPVAGSPWLSACPVRVLAKVSEPVVTAIRHARKRPEGLPCTPAYLLFLSPHEREDDHVRRQNWVGTTSVEVPGMSLYLLPFATASRSRLEHKFLPRGISMIRGDFASVARVLYAVRLLQKPRASRQPTGPSYSIR